MSPRAWGCTDETTCYYCGKENVPTCVGVYRKENYRRWNKWQCPHVRGGVPALRLPTSRDVPMSPRAWGCTEVRSSHEIL